LNKSNEETVDYFHTIENQIDALSHETHTKKKNLLDPAKLIDLETQVEE
jgi:hypothetical protein